MDARLKKVAITPAKFDDEGAIKADEHATVTIEVPMDSTAQRQAIMALCELLDSEWIVAEIDGKSIISQANTGTEG